VRKEAPRRPYFTRSRGLVAFGAKLLSHVPDVARRQDGFLLS
jgi:hypothetical protein